MLLFVMMVLCVHTLCILIIRMMFHTRLTSLTSPLAFPIGQFELLILCLYCFVYVPQHLHDNLQCVESEGIFFLRRDDVLVLGLLEFALSDF